MSLSGLAHRMPYGFGPSAGPRQGPEGRAFDWTDGPARRAVSVSYLTDGALLAGLLPPGFSLAGEPVVTVEVQYLKPARFEDALLVTAELEQRRRASLVFRQGIHRGDESGELLCTARVTAACLDADSMRPKPLPAHLFPE